MIPLDGDIFWHERFRDHVDEYAELCLRVCKNIGMAARRVLPWVAGEVDAR